MRKFISGIVSLSLAATTVVASVASGAFNPNKDPNGDGRLTYADAAYIYQCLGGAFKPSNLSQLDVDDNDVVSDVDAILVQRYAAGLSTSSFMGGDELNSVAANDTSTDYVVYNAQTGAYKRSYSLSVTNDDNSNTASPNTVFYPDDRITDWSNRGTVKILCSDSRGKLYLGSGFVVGRHTIATAAHVVFDTDNDQAMKVTQVLLFDEDQTDHPMTPKEYHIPTLYKNAANELAYNSYVYDYALITVEEDLKDYMSFNLGEIVDSAGTNHLPIVTVGFSVDYNGVTNHDEKMSAGVIYGLRNDYNNKMFYHTADTTGGNSGGPVYAEETLNGVTYHTVVGIHVRARSIETPANSAVRIDAPILKFYNGNTNIQY